MKLGISILITAVIAVVMIALVFRIGPARKAIVGDVVARAA